MGLFKSKEEKQAIAEKKWAIAKKQATEKHMEVKVSGGSKKVKSRFSRYVTIWIQGDGTLYINDDVDTVFTPIKLTIYPGYTYEVEVEAEPVKTKRTGRATGAIIGGAVLGPVGAAVGAAYGTGNTKTTGGGTRTETKRVDTYGVLTLHEFGDSIDDEIRLSEDSQRLSQLADLLGVPTETINNDPKVAELSDGTLPNANDPFDAIRKLSQLRDDGFISDEEFQQKKKDLLNL